MSGGAVTPESQLEESTSPADTTEDDPLPMRPWGRSQSLPAYADLIMVYHSTDAVGYLLFWFHAFTLLAGTSSDIS